MAFLQLVYRHVLISFPFLFEPLQAFSYQTTCGIMRTWRAKVSSWKYFQCRFSTQWRRGKLRIFWTNFRYRLISLMQRWSSELIHSIEPRNLKAFSSQRIYASRPRHRVIRFMCTSVMRNLWMLNAFQWTRRSSLCLYRQRTLRWLVSNEQWLGKVL